MRRLHQVVGIFVCILLPAFSYLDGSGRLAYTMFAETAEHRVVITITKDDGGKVDLAPTRLAPRAGTSAGIFLAGAERFVPGPVHRTPRDQLGALADLACVQAHADGVVDARRATVLLIERDDETSPDRRFEAERACVR